MNQMPSNSSAGLAFVGVSVVATLLAASVWMGATVVRLVASELLPALHAMPGSGW